MNSDQDPISTGLSEQERKAISERVLFEVQLRKALESEEPNRRQRLRKWLESNFALLVVGSLISSLLVPYFQQQQEVIRWQKQNQYDNLKYKLGQMRSGLEEFLTLSAYAPAMTEISKPVLANPKLNPEAYGRFAETFRDMKQKRFEQITKVMTLLIYFKNPEAIRTPYREYVDGVVQLSGQIEKVSADTMTEVAGQAARPPDIEHWKALKEQATAVAIQFAKVNASTDAVIQALRRQIEESERENETFK